MSPNAGNQAVSTDARPEIIESKEMPQLKDGKLYYYFELKDNQDSENIIKKEITGISIFFENKIYFS